jgi:excisionase family DNA binding protein
MSTTAQTRQPLTLTLNCEAIVELIDERVQMAIDQVREDSWMSTKSAARYLDCPVSRVHDLVMLRRLVPYRDGKTLRFRRSQLDAYMESGNGRTAVTR